MKYCACCGSYVYGTLKQWWNQDTGYSICKPCVDWIRSRGMMTDDEITRTYGKEGENW